MGRGGHRGRWLRSEWNRCTRSEGGVRVVAVRGGGLVAGGGGKETGGRQDARTISAEERQTDSTLGRWGGAGGGEGTEFRRRERG